MGSNFIENVQGYLSQCRDLENAHHERMLEIAIVTLEKVVKNELDEDIPDELRNVSESLKLIFLNFKQVGLFFSKYFSSLSNCAEELCFSNFKCMRIDGIYLECLYCILFT